MASPIKSFLFGGRGTGSTFGDFGLLIPRLAFGLLMALGHGMGKILDDGKIELSNDLVRGVEKMNFPAPTFFAWCAALTEFLGGFLLAAGLLTRPAALLLAFNMGVAAFVAHAEDPWYGGMPSKEFALLYFAVFLMFVFTGAGRISADGLIAGAGKGGGSKSSSKKPEKD